MMDSTSNSPSFHEPNNNHNHTTDEPSLSERVVSTVRKCPNLTIRPARLATQLGISIDEASAELCGLMSAVGEGASFRFERDKNNRNDNIDKNPPVMVFTFPSDWEQQLRRHARRETLRETLTGLGTAILRLAKVALAMGLLLSLFVVGLTGVVVLVSLLIATSRGGNRNHPLQHSIRRYLITLRQLLWCYAVFGNIFVTDDHNPDNISSSSHPFFQEVAMIVAGVLTVLTGGGLSPWYWMRMGRRRSYYRYNRWRSWNGRTTSTTPIGFEVLNTGTWRNDISNNNAPSNNTQDDSFRGFLSIAVEFLFGPSSHNTQNFGIKPSERLKWRLRAAVILDKPHATVSLAELAPFADEPPPTPHGDIGSQSAATFPSTTSTTPPPILVSLLPMVAHFNGIPASENNGVHTFRFPELLAEYETGGLPTPTSYKDATKQEDHRPNWKSTLYQEHNHHHPQHSSYTMTSTREDNHDNDNLPTYIHEQPHVFTKLTPKQFYTCVGLGLLNYVGVLWFQGFVHHPNNKKTMNPTLVYALQYLATVLLFYARFFLCLPLARWCVVVLRNVKLRRRNDQRIRWATFLKQQQESNQNDQEDETNKEIEIK